MRRRNGRRLGEKSHRVVKFAKFPIEEGNVPYKLLWGQLLITVA